MDPYVHTLQINIEQAVFTITLTQLLRTFGPVVGDQIKQQCKSFSSQATEIIQQVRKCQVDNLALQSRELPSIIFIDSKPYIALSDFYFAGSQSVVEVLASSFTLSGQCIKP